MNSSISFFVFVLAIYQASALLSFAHRRPPHPDCAEHDRYITADQVSLLNRGGSPDTQVMRQHLLCIWKEKGVMNEAGYLQKNNIKNVVVPAITSNRNEAQKVLTCAVQKSSPTETAYSFYKCISPLLASYNH